jgi:hypothetical protein
MESGTSLNVAHELLYVSVYVNHATSPMDTSTIRLALLQRQPATTPQQFSQHWHAPLVVPLFRYSGTLHVIYPPFSSPTPSQCQLSPTLPLDTSYLSPIVSPPAPPFCHVLSYVSAIISLPP